MKDSAFITKAEEKEIQTYDSENKKWELDYACRATKYREEPLDSEQLIEEAKNIFNYIISGD